MTTEKPNFWKISARPGQWIGIEEVDTIPSTLVLGIHDVGMNDVYQHIVELHNASEIQRTTGWYSANIYNDTNPGKYYVEFGPNYDHDLWEECYNKIGSNFESPAKAILAAWKWMQSRKEKE